MAGTPTCIVSSGAIALGLGSLGRSVRPRRVAELQAAAAVGQGILQRAWEGAVGRHGARAAQVLLTAADVRHRATYVNARSTLETLLAWDVIPVVNENDSTATDEITFGDNDALAAQVAVLDARPPAGAADRPGGPLHARPAPGRRRAGVAR